MVVTEADVHVSAQPSVEQLIAKLSSDMNMMFLSLNERFDKMESGLEQRISSKVAQLLDKRVNSELSKIRKYVNDRMDDFKESIKADLAADLDEIRDELTSRQPTLDTVSQNTKDLSLNIVIRNLSENSNENIKNKVNALFKDGLRLSDVSVSDAERKKSRSESKPRVVIAKLKNKNDKQRVMKKKSKLKDSRRFSKVFIHHDQVPSQRSVSSNFRAILCAMKVNNSNLAMRGSRVVYTESSDDQGSRRDNSRDSSCDQRTDYHNSRRDGGMSGSHRMTMRGQTSGMAVCLTTVNGRTLVIVVVMVEMPQGKTHMNIDREVTVNGVIRLLPGFGMSVVGKLILTVTILFLGLHVFYHLILTF